MQHATRSSSAFVTASVRSRLTRKRLQVSAQHSQGGNGISRCLCVRDVVDQAPASQDKRAAGGSAEGQASFGVFSSSRRQERSPGRGQKKNGPSICKAQGPSDPQSPSCLAHPVRQMPWDRGVILQTLDRGSQDDGLSRNRLHADRAARPVVGRQVRGLQEHPAVGQLHYAALHLYSHASPFLRERDLPRLLRLRPAESPLHVGDSVVIARSAGHVPVKRESQVVLGGF
mmetsp:Transcript_148875/g.414804  ORF Transcript_148875/g.414804 Transcript_148875/m.414804 type:complete len:229 (-) Transcript_148875:522-1208(-)